VDRILAGAAVRAEEMDRELPLESAKVVQQFIAQAECVD